MSSFIMRTSRLLTTFIGHQHVHKNTTLNLLGLKCLPLLGQQQSRSLNVQEHVSYKLLNDAGIPTPKFGVAKSGAEAGEIAKKLATENMVIKAQVLAGGRGVGHFKNGFKGGVRPVSSPKEAEEVAGKMIGQLLVTKQTGAAGRICNSVMVAERKFPRREFYFSVLMERTFQGPVIIASSQGGVEIEKVAEENPKAIIYEPVDIKQGLTCEQAQKIVCKVGLEANLESTVEMLMNLYDLFIKKDALLIEINPYAEDSCQKNSFFALDAKFRFDDNAEYRQKELFAMRDLSQEDPREIQAAKFDLNYITLDGNIACMVNGAGLAMATMDIIHLYGGEPANFLDVGGTASPKTVMEAFKIISTDPKVQCILVNIFGGIIRCDVIAEGIINASKELQMKVPVVVRLQGTNVDKARDMIKQAKLKVINGFGFEDTANMTVHLATIVQLAKDMNIEVFFEVPEGGPGKKGDGKKGKDGKCDSKSKTVDETKKKLKLKKEDQKPKPGPKKK